MVAYQAPHCRILSRSTTLQADLVGTLVQNSSLHKAIYNPIEQGSLLSKSVPQGLPHRL
jgi:hypothetical protein